MPVYPYCIPVRAYLHTRMLLHSCACALDVCLHVRTSARMCIMWEHICAHVRARECAARRRAWAYTTVRRSLCCCAAVLAFVFACARTRTCASLWLMCIPVCMRMCIDECACICISVRAQSRDRVCARMLGSRIGVQPPVYSRIRICVFAYVLPCVSAYLHNRIRVCAGAYAQRCMHMPTTICVRVCVYVCDCAHACALR